MAQEWERSPERDGERDAERRAGRDGGGRFTDHGGPAADGYGGGCLAAPVRWAVLVLVVPVRALWDLLVAAAKGLGGVLAWLGERLLADPARRLYRQVLAPAGRGAVRLLRAAGTALAWLLRWVVVAPVVWGWRWLVAAPASWLYAHVLTPFGHGLRRALRVLVAAPAAAAHRYVLRPAGTAVTRLCRTAVRLAAAGARATGAGGRWLAYTCVVAPLTWTYRRVLTPVGHGAVWTLRRAGRGVAAAARGTAAGAAWLWRWGVAAPGAWAYGHVLAPAGRGALRLLRALGAGAAWGWRWLVAAPASLIYAYVLKPLALGVAWLVRGLVTVVSRMLSALFAPLALLWRHVLAPAWTAAGRCTRWIWNATARPAGRAVRDAWRTARDAVAAARATARRTRMELRAALFGGRGEPAPDAALRAPDPLAQALSVDAPVPIVDLAKHEPPPGGRHR